MLALGGLRALDIKRQLSGAKHATQVKAHLRQDFFYVASLFAIVLFGHRHAVVLDGLMLYCENTRWMTFSGSEHYSIFAEPRVEANFQTEHAAQPQSRQERARCVKRA